jgi:hypothetical protein
MKFELVIIRSFGNRLVIPGREVDSRYLSVEDLRRVPEVEQFLEKLLGIRFHINFAVEETKEEKANVRQQDNQKGG